MIVACNELRKLTQKEISLLLFLKRNNQTAEKNLKYFFFVSMNISSPNCFLFSFFFVVQDRADHRNEDLSDYYLPAIYRIIHR